MKEYDDTFKDIEKCPSTREYKGYNILVQYSFADAGVLIGIIKKDNVQCYIQRKLNEIITNIDTEVYNIWGCSKNRSTHRGYSDVTEAINDLYEELKMCVDAIDLFLKAEKEKADAFENDMNRIIEMNRKLGSLCKPYNAVSDAIIAETEVEE